MRLNINLASQKFEDVRRFYVRWATAIGSAIVITLLLLVLTWINYSNSAESSQRIQKLQSEVADLQKERAAAEAIVNRPENHDVNAQKNYWNRQIQRRAFSWTQLFNDLQRIMPARAYVNSVRPEITQDNRVKLTVVIIGDTHGNGLELQQKMEKSERFHAPRINTETTQKDVRGGAEQFKFEIETYYTPTSETTGRQASKEAL